jgi:hypothetical protein
VNWYEEKVLDEIFRTSFSFAVLVPQGKFSKPISLCVKELDIRGILNHSGYYVFTDVPVNSYTLQVKSGDDVLHEQPIDLSTLDLGDPVIEVV